MKIRHVPHGIPQATGSPANAPSHTRHTARHIMHRPGTGTFTCYTRKHGPSAAASMVLVSGGWIQEWGGGEVGDGTGETLGEGQNQRAGGGEWKN